MSIRKTKRKTKELEIIDIGDYDVIIDYERKTPPFLTKFERAKLLGTRALQLSTGAPSVFTLNEIEEMKKRNNVDSFYLAVKELKEKKIPLFIRRHLEDGTYEDWYISELLG